MLNHITLMGRLTRDPELRYTQTQVPVASFTLAVDRDYDRETVDYIDIVAWRGTGEFVSKYFRKGSMAVVSGRLQMRDWKDKAGNKRTSAEVVAENVYFGEAKRSEGGQSRSQNTGSSYGDSYQSNSYGGYQSFDSAPSAGAFSDLSDTDGELPF